MISSSADAQVESIEEYDRSEIPVEDLDWAITEDITMAYEGEFYLPLTEEERVYWEEQDDWFPSTRSTLARNSVDFWVKEPRLTETGIKGGFEAKCLQNKVDIDEGDEVFRILMYDEEDRLNKSEVEERAEDILQQNTGYSTTPRGLLRIPIERRLSLQDAETSLEELEEDRNKFIENENSEEDRYFQLMETAPVSMPNDVFGKIRDTSSGVNYHINSVTIDTGYEDRIVVEVVQPSPWTDYTQDGETEYLEMELYEETETSKKSDDYKHNERVTGV